MSESEAAWALANPKEDMAKKLAASLRLNCPELPDPLLEYRFARDIVGDEAGVRQRLKDKGLKDWRFDLAWPMIMVAAEIDGGTHVQGRHVTGKGYRGDLIKYGWGMYYGWTIYRCDPEMLNTGMAMHQLSKVLKNAIRALETADRSYV